MNEQNVEKITQGLQSLVEKINGYLPGIDAKLGEPEDLPDSIGWAISHRLVKTLDSHSQFYFRYNPEKEAYFCVGISLNHTNDFGAASQYIINHVKKINKGYEPQIPMLTPHIDS